MISIELFVALDQEENKFKVVTDIFCIFFFIYLATHFATVSVSADNTHWQTIFGYILTIVKLSRQSPLQNMIYFPLIFWHSSWKYFLSRTAPFSKKNILFSRPNIFNTCIFEYTRFLRLLTSMDWKKSVHMLLGGLLWLVIPLWSLNGFRLL